MNRECLGCKTPFEQHGTVYTCYTCKYTTQPLKWIVATRIGEQEQHSTFIEPGRVVVPTPIFNGFGEIGSSLVCLRAIVQMRLLNLMYITGEFYNKITQSTGLPVYFGDVEEEVRQMAIWLQECKIGDIIERNGSALKICRMPYA